MKLLGIQEVDNKNYRNAGIRESKEFYKQIEIADKAGKK
jgi:hypothetical protein